jgi:dienelactone hydrolase
VHRPALTPSHGNKLNPERRAPNSTPFAFCALTVLVRADVVTKTVSYDANGTTFRSFLAYDSGRSGPQKPPGVLVFPEWWGVNDFVKHKAEQLAALGYVALAVDMYGDGRTTTNPEEARALAGQLYGKPLMAERARLGLDQLLKSGLADETRLASIGFCFGGTVSQVLVYTGAPLKAIVAFHAGLIPAPAGAGEKVRAQFLILHGGMDPMVKRDQADAFLDSLNREKLDYEFIVYSGAVHAFTNPDADKARAAGLEGVGYHAEVARRAWDRMQTFFRDIFGGAQN